MTHLAVVWVCHNNSFHLSNLCNHQFTSHNNHNNLWIWVNNQWEGWANNQWIWEWVANNRWIWVWVVNNRWIWAWVVNNLLNIILWKIKTFNRCNNQCQPQFLVKIHKYLVGRKRKKAQCSTMQWIKYRNVVTKQSLQSK